MKAAWSHALRLLALVLLCAVALQLYFLARVALMTLIDPQSTSFQRSEAWRLLLEKPRSGWRQQWVPYQAISAHLKRAVIASEDAGFTDHGGVDWEALEKAWERNQKAQARVAKLNAQLEAQPSTGRNVPSTRPRGPAQPRIVGGSTITQQLAKNLFLGSERSLARKGQEFLVTLMLEALLNKQRILEIYLNNVEWGEGVFGAEAAARHYFRTSAAQLGAQASARLAVMLPAPKRFERRPESAYVLGRAGVVLARMSAVEVP